MYTNEILHLYPLAITSALFEYFTEFMKKKDNWDVQIAAQSVVIFTTPTLKIPRILIFRFHCPHQEVTNR